MTFEEIDYGVPFAFSYSAAWVAAYKVAENKARLIETDTDIFLAPETEIVPDENGMDDV